MSKIFNFQFSIFKSLCLAILLGVFFLARPSFASNLSIQQISAQDPTFTTDSLNVDRQWALIASGFNKAWEKTLGSTSTVVAIIDTGIDEQHEDLKSSSFKEGYDFINNQSILPGSDSDDNGHGTIVAGIVGATPNNARGITGTNWQVTLMPIKALDKEGRGESAVVAKAIMWAADQGANVINLSFGGNGFDHDIELSKAVAYAFNKGAVIVAAAGNDSAAGAVNLDLRPGFPVCNDNDQNMVIGVTALDQNRVKPDFANYGKSCIDVAAPGRRILSAINIDPITKNSTEAGYLYASGTSMAAAFVSGQAALIKSMYPYATNKQIRDRIIATAVNVDNLNLAQCGGTSCAGRLGAGLISVPESLSQNFPFPNVLEGDVIRAEGDSRTFWIYGGQKRLISPMVFNQRFINSQIKILPEVQLNKIPSGSYATPLEGTLVKTLNNSTVYLISQGLKLPVTAQIFKQRGFNFADVKIADVLEADSWVTGKFLSPKEGTLVKTPNYFDLYWTVDGILHKISREFYQKKGLKIFPVLTVTKKDLMGYNIGEAYLR